MSRDQPLSYTALGEQEWFPERQSSDGLSLVVIGTYARTFAVDRLVNSFLYSSSESKKQIISLGAGSDTRFFRIINQDRKPPDVVYHELDFPSNTAQKVAMIKRFTNLKGLLEECGDYIATDTELHSLRYHLHAIDLRTLSLGNDSSTGSGAISHVDPDLPTLILSECCLTYLKPDAADNVVKHFTKTALKPETPIGLALYEPINPFDAFGKVMISNLAARGIVLQTVHKYNSLETQKLRLRSYGLGDGQGAIDADFLHEQWIGAHERERLNTVEMLDEVEELKMLLKHYCVAWGWRNGNDGSLWEGWQKIESQPS